MGLFSSWIMQEQLFRRSFEVLSEDQHDIVGETRQMKPLEQIARDIAKKHDIDPALVCAMCHHESGNWNQWAIRYEPAFYAKYLVPIQGISETERTARAFSYGLMQIMGQVAREFGFAGNYLSELLDPSVNLEFGCRKLARCLDRANGDVNQALLLYNGGGNKNYPKLVMQHYKRYSG